MNKTDKIIFYSLLSGDVYELSIDEIDNLDEFQIPILRKPKHNCKRCYGRGYIGQDLIKKYYPICSCIGRHIDKERIKTMQLK